MQVELKARFRTAFQTGWSRVGCGCRNATPTYDFTYRTKSIGAVEVPDGVVRKLVPYVMKATMADANGLGRWRISAFDAKDTSADEVRRAWDASTKLLRWAKDKCQLVKDTFSQDTRLSAYQARSIIFAVNGCNIEFATYSADLLPVIYPAKSQYTFHRCCIHAERFVRVFVDGTPGFDCQDGQVAAGYKESSWYKPWQIVMAESSCADS